MRSLITFTICLASSQFSYAGFVIDNFLTGALPTTSIGSPGTVIVQEDLPLDSVMGGIRRVSGRSLERAEISIDGATEGFKFTASESFGYFSLTYGSEQPIVVDLTTGGSNAIRMSFEETLIPPYFQMRKRGIYRLAVGDEEKTVSRSFATEIFSIDGAGEILIPFADFPGIDFKSITSISVDAGRIEAGSQILLTSFTTTSLVPEPTSLALALSGSLFIFARRI